MLPHTLIGTEGSVPGVWMILYVEHTDIGSFGIQICSKCVGDTLAISRNIFDVQSSEAPCQCYNPCFSFPMPSLKSDVLKGSENTEGW